MKCYVNIVGVATETLARGDLNGARMCARSGLQKYIQVTTKVPFLVTDGRERESVVIDG